MSILTIGQLTSYVQACADRGGLSVQWDTPDSIPRTDGTTVWIPALNADMSEDDEVKLRRFIAHETSHVVYSDFDVLKNKRPKGLLKIIVNILEDHRVDYLNEKEWLGDRDNSEKWPTIFRKTAKHECPTPIASVFVWEEGCRDWLSDNIGDVFAPNADLCIVGKLTFYTDVLKNIRTIANPTAGTGAVYELACRILKEVFDEEPSAYEDTCDEKGTSKPAKEGEKEEKGDTCDGKDKSPTFKEPKFVDMEGAESLPMTEHSYGEGYNAANFKCGKGTYVPSRITKVIDDYDGMMRSGRTIDAYRDTITAYSRGATSLANKLRTALQIRSKDRWEYGKKSGVLRNNSLWRVAAGVDDKVFKRKIENDTLDVAVQVLVDASGSMSGEKYAHAAAAAVILNNTLANVLHVPLEIAAFTENWEETHMMYLWKSFSEKVSDVNLIDRCAKTGVSLLDNVDGESMVWGYNRIVQRREKRKVMIVLSDGQPCGGRSKGSVDVHTRMVIKAIEKSKVELLGVGVLYSGVKDYYKKWEVINTASQLESKLLQIINKHVF